MRRPACLASLVAVLVSLISSRPAVASGERATCVDAYERSQMLRRYNDLIGAREELLRCEASCPKQLASDCRRWRGETEKVLPNVVLVAKRADGREATIDSVVVDGRKVELAAGAPIWLNAGTHALRVQAEGASGERLIALRPEERARPVVIVYDSPPGNATPVAVAARDGGDMGQSGTQRPAQDRSRVPSYAIGGVGGAALVAAGVLTLYGHVERNRLENECAPHCLAEQADAVRTTWLLGGALSLVGAAALVLAVALWPASPVRSTSVRGGPGSLSLSF